MVDDTALAQMLKAVGIKDLLGSCTGAISKGNPLTGQTVSRIYFFNYAGCAFIVETRSNGTWEVFAPLRNEDHDPDAQALRAYLEGS